MIILQLKSLLDINVNNIARSNTNYLGISLLTLKDTFINIDYPIRKIEAFQVDHLTARVQKNQIKTTGTSSFDSLKSVAPIEQYEHLRQILYKQKKKYIEHAIFRD